jgi:protein-disulfide isomerase
MRLALAAVLTSAALLAQQAAVEGNPKSRVKVLIYEDLQCSDCAVFRQILDQHLLPKYGDRVAFEHKEFPLERHLWARKAAIAARYFGEIKPELGTEFRRYAFANLEAITPENFNEKLAEFARKHKQDPSKATAALDDKRLAGLVQEDYEEGVARGVSRTPTIFVNGETFVEPSTPDDISKALDQSLAGKQP